MNKKDLAIATISFVRDVQEDELLRSSLTQLSKLNIPIFITDGGSDESFLEYVKNLPNVEKIDRSKGLWNQTSNSLTKAYESKAKYIFYTEPDKSNFFDQSLSTMIERSKVEDKTGVVMAARSQKAFQTFPSFQQMTETTINNCCKEIIGLEFDYVYGPFLINSSIIPHLKKLDAGIGWGWRPYAFNISKRLGYSVAAFTGDFYCPQSQRQDDVKERIYRMKQMNQNIEGLILSEAAAI